MFAGWEATDFEERHSLLVHQLIVGGAFLTYLLTREDVVWRLIKHHDVYRVLRERILFTVATLQVALGAAICTWTAASRQPVVPGAGFVETFRRRRYLGEFIYALGLGSLAPLSGFLILVFGEAVRILRLVFRRDFTESAQGAALPSSRALWPAVRQERFKWGMLVAMAVFTITLSDRVGEVLAVCALAAGALLTLPFFDRLGNRQDNRPQF